MKQLNKIKIVGDKEKINWNPRQWPISTESVPR